MVEKTVYEIDTISPVGEFVIEFMDASQAPLTDIEVKITIDSTSNFSGKTRSDGTFRTTKPQSVFDVSLTSGTPATGSTTSTQTASAEAGPAGKKASTGGSGGGVETPVSLA